MLTTPTALPELKRMLAEAGFDDAHPSLPVLWGVLREWTLLPVEGVNPDPTMDADLLLFECSLYLRPPTRHSRGSAFSVSFTRQFSFEDADGEYIGMEQLHATLTYAVHDDFRAITEMRFETFGSADQLWGAGGPLASEWATGVEATRSYTTALTHTPVAASFSHGPV
jgi:hypothetical protein